MTLPATKFSFGSTMQLALAGSIALHGVVLFAIPVSPQGQHNQSPALEARLQPATAASAAMEKPSMPQARTITTSVAPTSAKLTDEALPPLQADAQAQSAQQVTAEASTSLAALRPDAASYFTNEQLDVPPHMLGEVQQFYPAHARSAAVEGYVTLELLINEQGKVESATVVQAQPAGYFEEAALNMLRKQRYTPPIKQNHAVKSRWQTTVRYRLQN